MELGLLTSTQILTSLGVSTYMGSVELVMFGTNSLFGKNNMPTAVEFGIPVVPVVGSPLIAMARASLVTSHFDFVPVPAAVSSMEPLSSTTNSSSAGSSSISAVQPAQAALSMTAMISGVAGAVSYTHLT